MKINSSQYIFFLALGLFLFISLVKGDGSFIMTRSGGLNSDYKSLEIDVGTGYFFNQANKKGRLTPEDLKKLDELVGTDQFRNLDPKYINPSPASSPSTYRYTMSFPDKKIGVIFDLTSKYPEFLDQFISIFEKYSI